MTRVGETTTGGCHCGAVRFEVKLTDGFSTVRRCATFYCRLRGAVAASVDLGGITFARGENTLTRYRFNTETTKQFFCARCGITHTTSAARTQASTALTSPAWTA